MIFTESGGHYYTKHGADAHDADLRRARKELLYRSVTSIDKEVIKNDILERWKVNQVAKAAANNPRQPHEADPKEYAKRLIEIAFEKRDTAADFGSRFHKSVESLPLITSDTQLIPFIERFVRWKEANVVQLTQEEVLLDHEIGCAGRTDGEVDFKGVGQIIADWKTQDVKKDEKGRKKPIFYESFPRQLAFYESVKAKAAGRFPAFRPAVSVIIDSNEPDDPFVKVYTPEELRDAYEEFVTAVYRWHKDRAYWPVGKWKLSDQLLRIGS